MTNNRAKGSVFSHTCSNKFITRYIQLLEYIALKCHYNDSSNYEKIIKVCCYVPYELQEVSNSHDNV